MVARRRSGKEESEKESLLLLQEAAPSSGEKKTKTTGSVEKETRPRLFFSFTLFFSLPLLPLSPPTASNEEEEDQKPTGCFTHTHTHAHKEKENPPKKRSKKVEKDEKGRKTPFLLKNRPQKKNTCFPFSSLPPLTRPAHPLRRRDHLLQRDLRVLAPEVVALGQEEHAVALLALPHRHAGAVPEPLRGLGGLVVVVAAGAQGGAELVLVLGEALDYDGGDRLVDAEVGPGAVESLYFFPRVFL